MRVAFYQKKKIVHLAFFLILLQFLLKFKEEDYLQFSDEYYHRIWTRPVQSYAKNYTKFDVSLANFRTLEDDLKLNIKLSNGDKPNDLLHFLASKGDVSHFVELIPSVNDIFIQTVKNSK